jgi:hypothetical protein
MDDRHRGFKRWEKARQMSGLEADPDLVGPLAWCRVKGIAENPSISGLDSNRIRVYITRIFTKDLVCVHFYGQVIPAGLPGPCWLVRGGIEWSDFLREVVKHYRSGLPVAEPFRPQRKISPEIVAKMADIADADLPAVFAKLRESQFLPKLPILDRSTCPSGLTWDTLRATFQDFLEISSIKGSLPP